MFELDEPLLAKTALTKDAAALSLVALLATVGIAARHTVPVFESQQTYAAAQFRPAPWPSQYQGPVREVRDVAGTATYRVRYSAPPYPSR